MKPLTDTEFQLFADYLYEYAGIKLTLQKKNLLITRLSQVIEKQGYPSFKAYFEHMKSDKTGKTLSEFINKISTNHTYFYREEDHFTYLEKTVLPEIIGKYGKQKDLRMWSAGCSNGSEPYTLTMLLNDYFEQDMKQWDTKILATDISEKVLNMAVKGIYKYNDIDRIPPLWKIKYFKKINQEDFQVNEDIRNNVIFRRLNLLSEFPFKKPFHIIFCRNVMIYFDEPTKQRIISKFHDLLVPGGYLFIGHSETIDRSASDFVYVRPSVYRREG